MPARLILKRRSKYGNRRTTAHGRTFASAKEANRWGELLAMHKAGLIFQLRFQPAYQISIKGVEVCQYVADSSYFDVASQVTVVEDVKSKATRTAVYKLKKKLMLAVHGITIREI